MRASVGANCGGQARKVFEFLELVGCYFHCPPLLVPLSTGHRHAESSHVTVTVTLSTCHCPRQAALSSSVRSDGLAATYAVARARLRFA